MSTDQTISLSQTTNCGSGPDCLREEFATEAELCGRVRRQAAAIAFTAAAAALTPLGPAPVEGGDGERERGLVPTAPPLQLDGLTCIFPNLTAPIYFRLQEVDKLYDDKDKCTCEGCKDSIEFEVEANDAILTNYPIVFLSGDDLDPAVAAKLLQDASAPNVITCKKRFPVRCCCKGGSSGPDYVEYGITICYVAFIKTPPCFVTPPTELTDLPITVVYAAQVRRLDRTHYRAVDSHDCTPGLRTWVRTGVKNVVVPPLTEEAEEAIHTDPYAPVPHDEKHDPCKPKCKPCPPPNPCDCPFTKVKVPYGTLAQFRLKEDEPCRVCGVECECPMKKSGTATDCDTRCRQCKVAKISLGIPFYFPPDLTPPMTPPIA